MALRFERLTEADLPMLAEWLRRPHVAEWWTDCQTLAEVREQYLPTLADDSTVLPYIAYLESLPIGYIQSYVAAAAGGSVLTGGTPVLHFETGAADTMFISSEKPRWKRPAQR